MTPPSCRSFIISWMAAIASLRYFLLIRFCLHKIASFQPHRELRLGQCQYELCGFLELFFLKVIDVRPLALGEPVHEECLGSAPEEDYCAVSFCSSRAWSGDPLCDAPA